MTPAPTPSDFAADAPWSVIRDSNHPACQTGPMTIPSPAARIPAGFPVLRRVAGACLAAGLLVPAAGTAATAADAREAAGSSDAAEFSAPAQRPAVQFDAPRQRTPAPADDAAQSSSSSQSAADQQTAADQRPSADQRVSDLTDPATGLGPQTAAQIPEETGQLLVASGADEDATDAHLALWERDGDSWVRTATMDGRNGANGWKEDRREGDRTTPAGVFTLSDAGGYLEDPGSALPYYRDEGLRGGAEAVYGDGYASVFDYVIAIDYNRKTGVAPTENTRPQGWDAGGKIWLHVEHGSPTRGCIALDADDMRHLLTTLDPDQEPRIAMGSEEFLAQ